MAVFLCFEAGLRRRVVDGLGFVRDWLFPIGELSPLRRLRFLFVLVLWGVGWELGGQSGFICFSPHFFNSEFGATNWFLCFSEVMKRGAIGQDSSWERAGAG